MRGAEPVTGSEPDLNVLSADREVGFEAYVGSRQHSLLRTAFLLTGEAQAAEDLLQTALARLYLAWGRVRRDGALDAYVRRIMVNEYTTWWRRAWRRRETIVELVEDRAATDGPDQDELAERDAVWRVVGELPPRQRAAVVLRYYEDLSEAETAALLGCSVGTVKSQTSRALSRLRQLMAPDERWTQSSGDAR